MSSNDENNKSNLDKKVQRQIKAKMEEVALLDRFKRVASAKLELMAAEADASTEKYQLGDAEKNVLRQMNGMGIKEGIAAGIFTFLVLRKGPIYVAKWVHRRRLAQQQAKQAAFSPQPGMKPPPAAPGGFQLSNPASTPGNPFERAAQPHHNFPRSKNVVIRGIWFLFDSALSLMMAASVSIAYTDTDAIRQQLLELPLLEGRSLISDSVCDEIVQEVQKVQAEDLAVYHRLMNNRNPENPSASYLQGIVEFSQHCQRRKWMERKLRQEQGLAPNQPIELPAKVPPDAPRLVISQDGQESVLDGNEDPFGGTMSNEEWASQFVMDQEDDDDFRG